MIFTFIFAKKIMKKTFIIISMLLSLQGYSQTLQENKTDDNTKATVKRTSWEKMVYQLSSVRFTCYFRFSKIDSSYYMDIKLMNGGNEFSIEKGSKLMLRLSNDSLYTLVNLTRVTSSTGAGAVGSAGSQGMGIQTSYISLSDKTFKMLEKFRVKKIRIYNSDGYLESDVLDKFSSLVMASIKLVR
jgi:hypothetical protein